jgi:hypothetical protein
MTLRGEDTVAEKMSALKRLDDAGVFTTLVTTVSRGVNEDEIGDLIKLGLSTPHCSGMAIQPVFGSGRNLPIDPRNRVTPTGVLSRLKEQTGGLLDASDFLPLPCSHQDCCDITYLIQTADGQWRSIPKLIGKENLKQWISFISNTVSIDTIPPPVAAIIREGLLQRVFSEQLRASSTDICRHLAAMCNCVPGLTDQLGAHWSNAATNDISAEQAAERTFRITVKMFMDTHTFHAARIKQCCVHTGTFEDNPRRFSFCWRWLFADATDMPTDQLAVLS